MDSVEAFKQQIAEEAVSQHRRGWRKTYVRPVERLTPAKNADTGASVNEAGEEYFYRGIYLTLHRRHSG